MKKSLTYIMSSLLLLISILVACEKLEPIGPEESELLDGPIEGLSYSESKQFLDGDIAFNDDDYGSTWWVDF